jgi:carbon storage regulator
MLVLTRKKDEVIVIGDNIRITVVAIHGDTVRVGVQAPREIPVHRQEVYDAIHAGRTPGDNKEIDKQGG